MRDAGSDFPLENLPYGAAALAGGVHLVVAYGERMLDLHAACAAGLFNGLPPAERSALNDETWNRFMGLGPAAAGRLRQRLTELLKGGGAAVEAVMVPQDEAAMRMPAVVGDYTDFYASIDHARNVGALFRPANPLLPNYVYVPVGYHGRSSSVGVSPQRVARPSGQLPAKEGEAPGFGPTRQLDYELEVGFWIGEGNGQGEPIGIGAAEDHVFGACLLNDWSARDIQRWEYQPLGPFLGKNFATTISPWIVPWAALAPHRVARRERGGEVPEPLAYLEDARDRERGGINVQLEVWLLTQAMQEQGLEAVRLSRGNLRDLFWTPAQMVAHHTVNGCNLRPGDLLGSGTVSGAGRESWGSLLELTAGGKEPLRLLNGESRSFLVDGDEITFHAWCEGPGLPRIGWGTCRGTVRAGAGKVL